MIGIAVTLIAIKKNKNMSRIAYSQMQAGTYNNNYMQNVAPVNNTQPPQDSQW